MAVRSIDPDLELTNPAGYSDTTTNGEGRAWLATWLGAHSAPRQRALAGVYAGHDAAVVVVAVPDLEAATAAELTIDNGFITTQSMLRWRDAAKPGGTPDLRLAPVDELVAAYAAAWGAGDRAGADSLYRPGAIVVDRTGRTWQDPANAPALHGARLATISPGGRDGAAIFVEPDVRPRTVLLVLDTPDGCSASTLVVLHLAEGRIESEQRYGALDDVGRCLGDAPGWWSELTPPRPISDQITGTARHPDGSAIPLVNGTPELQRLAEWALGRFTAAGLHPPSLGTIAFAPVPECRDIAGVVIEGAAGALPRLVHCTDVYTVCVPSPEHCAAFDLSARFALLHELAHAWLLDIDDGVRAEFVEATGSQAWRDGSIPWHRRGVERAADTLAWGLMDDPVGLTRFGDPPCATTRSEFALLTGTAPLRTCPG